MAPKIPPTLPAFGKRLKRQRLSVGMKQAALADLLGVNQTTVSRWESGLQTPDDLTQQAGLDVLTSARIEDAALKRLVQQSTGCVHLVEEANHVCLAYSESRAKDWDTTRGALLGTSLWQFASDEIRQAESELEAMGWWDTYLPAPKAFDTSEVLHDRIRISAGTILWERVYLSDGTPARLVSGLPSNA
ncbi:helix-turn-helix domain-containing protein [Roseobacter weihaiensis]|uniref:helix-turn-helix domain-containing protein n=1 Tax=Roseobacter weihaiensis TaxID=2763262 RepID=UPI001D0B9A98|nr:helix-turn-helix transcriptional regulator [Roseobacter sp. H9]